LDLEDGARRMMTLGPAARRAVVVVVADVRRSIILGSLFV
jgi:hypothetical protein